MTFNLLDFLVISFCLCAVAGVVAMASMYYDNGDSRLHKLQADFPFKPGDLVRIKTTRTTMMFTGFNGLYEANCTFLDGTNEWKSFEPLTLELVEDQ